MHLPQNELAHSHGMPHLWQYFWSLLLDEGINLIEVVRLLKERRPQCLTNKGFRLELVRKARRMNRLAGPDDEDYEPPRRRARDGLFS